jgi:hypothetical protein
LAPIVGSAVFEAIDYRPTTDVMTIVCLIWSLIFFIGNVGFRIYPNERKIKALMEKNKSDYLLRRTADTPADIKLVECESEEDKLRRGKTADGLSNVEIYEANDAEIHRNESMMDFLQRKRMQWDSELVPNKGANHLSSIAESKNETFLDSRIDRKS